MTVYEKRAFKNRSADSLWLWFYDCHRSAGSLAGGGTEGKIAASGLRAYFLFSALVCSGWICICKNSVLDYRMERNDPESVGDA